MSFFNPSENHGGFSDQSDVVRRSIASLVSIGEKLLPKIEDVAAEKIGDMVDQEMLQTTNAIEQAAKRFEVGSIKPLSRFNFPQDGTCT